MVAEDVSERREKRERPNVLAAPYASQHAGWRGEVVGRRVRVGFVWGTKRSVEIDMSRS